MAQVVRDGVRLAYEERGAGPGALVLIHGITCDRGDMAFQLAHFGASWRTVAIDLRGHGESDAPAQEYTIDGFADDVAWTCERLGLERPVVVGHSLGGLVALGLAANRPELPAAVVMLDSVLLADPARVALMGEAFAVLRTPAFPERIREYFAAFFGPVDDPQRRERILARAAAAPPAVIVSAWENGLLGFDAAEALRRCAAPLLYLDAGTPNADLETAARLAGDWTLGRTVGSGHFHQLELPDQVDAMIDRFLRVQGLP